MRSHPYPGIVLAGFVVLLAMALACGSSNSGSSNQGSTSSLCTVTTPQPCSSSSPRTGTAVKIAYLHHSTGEYIWDGGVSDLFAAYNTAHGTDYQIEAVTYPDTSGGYEWANYPYDYWNLWVNHQDSSQDHGELNLDQLAASYDVIVFKHCYPVSDIEADEASSSVSSATKTIANYQLQYAALKSRMKDDFPSKSFLVWTGAALVSGSAENIGRSQQFFNWVKNSWDESGDNIFVWDFYALETEGSAPYLNPRFALESGNSHPHPTFSQSVAPCVVQRIIDVVEGCADTSSILGNCHRPERFTVKAFRTRSL